MNMMLSTLLSKLSNERVKRNKLMEDKGVKQRTIHFRVIQFHSQKLVYIMLIMQSKKS